MSSGDAEHEMVRGGFFRVVFARNSEGAEPAADFLAEARGDRHARSCKKLLVTITRFASCQPGTFRDPQRFKQSRMGFLSFVPTSCACFADTMAKEGCSCSAES